jgi:hypothetical protein
MSHYSVFPYEWHILTLLTAECGGNADKMWFFHQYADAVAEGRFHAIIHSTSPSPARPLLPWATKQLLAGRFEDETTPGPVLHGDLDALVGPGNWMWDSLLLYNEQDVQVVVPIPLPTTPEAFAIFRLMDWGEP